MIEENDIYDALRELYRQVGTQKRLAEMADITQSTINAYLNRKAKIENMPLGVFMRLFRDARIDFFGNPKPDNTANDLTEIREELSSLRARMDEIDFEVKNEGKHHSTVLTGALSSSK